MALLVPTSSPYTATYSPSGTSAFPPVGLMRAGWTLRWDVHEHRVDDTTSWGKSLIEMMYLGADWFLSAQSLEYAAAGLPDMAWPYNNGAGAVGGAANVFLNVVGARATTTSCGTLSLGIAAPGLTASPAILFAPQAINAGSAWNFDSKNRETAVHLRLLPSSMVTGASAIVSMDLANYSGGGNTPGLVGQQNVSRSAYQDWSSGGIKNNNASNVTRWFWTS